MNTELIVNKFCPSSRPSRYILPLQLTPLFIASIHHAAALPSVQVRYAGLAASTMTGGG